MNSVTSQDLRVNIDQVKIEKFLEGEKRKADTTIITNIFEWYSLSIVYLFCAKWIQTSATKNGFKTMTSGLQVQYNHRMLRIFFTLLLYIYF